MKNAGRRPGEYDSVLERYMVKRLEITKNGAVIWTLEDQALTPESSLYNTGRFLSLVRHGS